VYTVTECHFEKTPNAGILHYNDKQLRVNNVMECLKACLTETMFNCRSVDYLRTGTNHQNTGECLLSKDNHFTVPEENFNSYVGWDYYIKICK
jgi:PAN domain